MRFVAGKLLWGKGCYEYDFLLSMLSSLNGLTNYFLINACKRVYTSFRYTVRFICIVFTWQLCRDCYKS